jgi:hypothetical protein
VDLHQIERRLAQELQGALHLGDPFVTAADPDLGGDPQLIDDTELGGEVSNDAFGSAVHRRRVDDAPTRREKTLQHFSPGRPVAGRRADVERLPGPQPDRGNLFAGGGNRAHEHVDSMQRVTLTGVARAG